MRKWLPMLLTLIILTAAPKTASAACDANCEFIRKVIAGEPDRFKNLHDFDGIVSVHSPAGGYCAYEFEPRDMRARIECRLTEGDSTKVKAVYLATKLRLSETLGRGWLIAAEEPDKYISTIAAKNPATGAEFKLYGAFATDFVSFEVKNRSPKKVN